MGRGAPLSRAGGGLAWGLEPISGSSANKRSLWHLDVGKAEVFTRPTLSHWDREALSRSLWCRPGRLNSGVQRAWVLPCGAHPSDFDSVSLSFPGKGRQWSRGVLRAMPVAAGEPSTVLLALDCSPAGPAENVAKGCLTAPDSVGSEAHPTRLNPGWLQGGAARAELRASPACSEGNSKFYYERLERQTRGATRWGHRRETEAEGGGHGPRSVRLRTQREALWALDPLGRGGRVSRKNIPENCCILGRQTSSAHTGSPTGRRLPGRVDGRLPPGSPRGRASVCVCLRPHLRFP